VLLPEHLKERVTLARLFGALLALYAVSEWIVRARDTATFLGLILVVMGAILGFRLIRILLRKLIWRLRNRLIVTYVFIGVVPIVLIFTLAVLGTFIVVGQVAVYLVSSELERRAVTLEDPVRLLIAARDADRGALLQMGALSGARLPGVQIVVEGQDTMSYPAGITIQPPAGGWKDFTGYVSRDGVYYSAAIAQKNGTTVAALAPITREVLEKLSPGIGVLRLSTDHGDSIAGTMPPAWHELGWLDFPIYGLSPIPFTEWTDPGGGGTVVLSVETRPSAVLDAVFSKGLELRQVWLWAFVITACLLFFVELVSIVIGLSLTRTITGAVHKLYEGTLLIGKGDFSWRIRARGHDQLAELGRSFNNMAAQLEGLVVIAREKERLQSELEIASEVQNQLFPRTAPVLQTMELAGSCQPARMVSGDYYDYLRLPDGNLALAIGDVAGKGISAALLMASIQSIVRTQLAAGMPSTSSLVAQLNRQLHASTAPEKYATFFFGAYDESSRILTYTNAGHLPPLLLRAGEATLLEVTGTVVGAFPSIRYEEQTVEIQPDDLLIAYTDGITEPENAYGAEFGAERLAETAFRYHNSEPKEIVAKIMEAVRHWSAAPEFPDDMTVIVARGLA
jgi:phosphoserine phosphatase RsbU/P